MQTDRSILLRFVEDLKLRELAPTTQKQFLWMAREYLEWPNRDAKAMNEEEIEKYLNYLTNTKKLGLSTVRVRNTMIHLLFSTMTSDETFCPPPRRKLAKKGCLKPRREAFMRYLEDMGYSRKSLKNYDWTVRCLDQFMHEGGQIQYTHTVGEAFLEESSKSGRHTSGMLEVMKYVLRRFNCFMEGETFTVRMPIVSKECPAQFSEGLRTYMESMRLRGLRESTIEQKRYNIQKALVKFDKAGIYSYADIKADDIYNAFGETSDKVSFCSPVRGFLQHLFKTGDMDFDFSVFVPSVRKAKPVPSVYTKAETDKLLESVDVNTDAGKRDKAVILLALRLGIRSGDISNLKITDVNFNNKTISFIQGKTGVPQRLELLRDIEDALLSYMATARPVSNIPNVFLSVRSPIRPITGRAIYNLTSRHFKKSGVDAGERKQGPHALRMTLSSELVAEKIPYDAVRKILGHEDPFTIKHYVKFDIESLRSCAISVPPVAGKLAAYMAARSEGRML